MNEKQKHILLKTAKEALRAAITKSAMPKVESDDALLRENRGCFVTLKNGEELRGCIGSFVADKPLVEMVAEMAVSSATSDPRFFFQPITAKELDELDIEISVLSPLKKTDDPLSLRLGIDGIYIKKGSYSGCFLPQVATETGWSKEEFLSYCCSHKAGMEPDAWKDKDTTVLLFTAEIFGAAFKDI